MLFGDWAYINSRPAVTIAMATIQLIHIYACVALYPPPREHVYEANPYTMLKIL